MDTQHLNAPSRAKSPVAADDHPAERRPTSGVVHDNVRIATRFTVVGNHLAQHRTLSATAIGIAVHIQSLPTGARVDITTLTSRFPEGRTRVSAALRELETHGYLRRERRRAPEPGHCRACRPPSARNAPAGIL
ncbi:hypothetical protein [Streptomyces silvensis]|uniref:Uncharacterized protein n=1 Tax=Streptomyces silvensis TaxID=1765722 RepID=A0A0W7X4E9_9ACTN|nr:hypothetical protein AT728_09635 [Streptomyces silvensis]